MFSKTSRYQSVADAIHVDAKGRERSYKRLRILPQLATQTSHVVSAGERLDRIAFHYYGDAEQFWRIADSNNVLRPETLTERIGRRLALALV
ncbi:MAG TPA: LysM domain-containing protein [Polyangiaceae bacterium]